jgi:N-acetylmuramoyl-L-alanine amidase
MRWTSTRPSSVFVLLLLLCIFAAVALTQTLQNSSQAVQPAAPLQPAPPAPPQVLIDAAHGGGESGAMLNPAVPEKDVTLVFARRLRQELGSRGISSRIIRDNVATMTTDQRAEIVNSVRPVFYIAVHVSSLGKGISIFAGMQSAAKQNRGPFVNWQAAQSDVVTKSLWAQQQVVASIQKTGFPVHALFAPLRPLNNLIVPAVAVEFAPATGDASQLTSTDYQQMTCAALSNGIASLVPALRSKAVAP